METVFHKGEIAVQQLTGNAKGASRVGRIIQDMIYPGAVAFIKNQPLALLSSTDENGQPWLSPLIGEIGFVEVLNYNQLTFDEAKIKSTKTDIFYRNIEANPEVAVLFIEPATRMRFRVNGLISNVNNKLQVQVQEAYGNCPSYIQAGNLSVGDTIAENSSIISSGDQLGRAEKEWIASADTLYVATRSLDGRTDASHRGGNTGFVQVLDDGTLRIPDYSGNNMFNSLGNIYENPNTGLLFINFEKGEILQLTGKGKLQFEQTSENDLKLSGGTGRFWLFETTQWIRTKNHHEVDWEFLEYSPVNPKI